jgi:outer membrane protein assembly factor BamB
MYRTLRIALPLAAILCTLAVLVAPGRTATGVTPTANDLAKQILDSSGVRGGLVVHLGCGDGRLTAALRPSDSYVVHGLDTDAGKIGQARTYIRQLGLYGPVSVERWNGNRLPYAENLVNLVVAETLGGISNEEAMRVLAPGGTLYTKKEGRWTTSVKSRPANIDEWTHYLHDASGNAVAHDQVVGPPRRMQWLTQPQHTRSHEHIPSIYALVSSAGRIFYIADEAPIGSIRQLPQWRLVARDAYNGTVLWKQDISAWFPHIVNWGQTPSQLERKLVAVGDRVYVSLGLHSPLSVLDAATGQVLKVYENTAGTEEIILHQGTLLLAVRSVTEQRVAQLVKFSKLIAASKSPLDDRDTAEPLVKGLKSAESKADVALLALDAKTGRTLWKKDGDATSNLKVLTLCALGDRAFYQNGKEAICLDLKTGRQLWSASQGPLRVVCDQGVICGDGKTVAALAIDGGKPLWKADTSLSDVKDAFVINGSLWLGGFRPCPGKRSSAWGPYFLTQLDLATGKTLQKIEPENPGHHHRCYLNKATDRYILGGRRGTEFIDLKSGEVGWNSWVRGVCKYGVMPCNGLFYAPPHACACYIATKLTGFYVLAPQEEKATAGRNAALSTNRPELGSAQPAPLEQGPAYSAASNPQSVIPSPSDWPTYRHDVQRSGASHSSVPTVLRCRWETKVGGKLTSPTICDGKVFVASVDEHRLCALEADSGKSLWNFTADARVDSPPTLYQGRAIFGCRDGAVYSVQMADGALAWRFHAARDPRRVEVNGQLEAASPVYGSVLVSDGAAYCTAGRSSYLDGGIDLVRLDPASGKTLSKTAIYSPDPETGKQPAQSAPYAMPGALADILSGDADHVYLRDAVFDKQTNAQPSGNPHLFTLTGFLDDSWAHRSYWIFGTQCSISTGCCKREKDLIYGRLLSFDDTTIYGYGRATVHWSDQLQDGPYRLFAAKYGEEAPQWAKPLPIQVRAMVLADKMLLVAGPSTEEKSTAANSNASRKAELLVVSAADGSVLARYALDASPLYDGMATAAGRLYMALENGRIVCMDQKASE